MLKFVPAVPGALSVDQNACVEQLCRSKQIQSRLHPFGYRCRGYTFIVESPDLHKYDFHNPNGSK